VGTELDKNRLEELLSALKGSVSLCAYNLTLYCRSLDENDGQSRFYSCCSIVHDQLCTEISRQFFEPELEDIFQSSTPAVHRYGGGFFGFLIPFTMSGADFCLIGDGVRDHSIDLWQLADWSRREGAEVFSLFYHVETLTVATFQEVAEVARGVARQLADLSDPSLSLENNPLPAEPADSRLLAISEALEQLDCAQTLTETVTLACETIAAHFTVPGLALGLQEVNGARYQMLGVWGVQEELGTIPKDQVGLFLSRDKVKKTVLLDANMRALLPALQATSCTSFPLLCQGERLGFLTLLDTTLQQAELPLVSMVVHAAARRLSRILRDAEQARACAFSERLMSLANTLLLVESKEELYEAILGIAADLVDATQGSIILIDKDGEEMHIVFTLGMTLKVARSLPIKVGKGIAGKVALTGEPLLVNDVEIDSRVAMANRPRFKSKSLVCIPLKLKERIIGVLNLSDKKNLAPFSDADLQILTSFANLASLMIERTLVLEESVRFEQLSITDSLTGLYNRRFLKNRLEEELNRSNRQGLSLTVLFIDLDFFKNYNDVCGHLAGDDALRKTSEIIKASLREMDIVARYGGEEFCALLPGTSKAEALVVAERIRFEIESEQFPGDSDIPFRRLTASLGVASFPEDGRTFTDLIHASDVALYQAKSTGRNRIVAAHTPSAPTLPESSGSAFSQSIDNSITLAKTLQFSTYHEATLRSVS